MKQFVKLERKITRDDEGKRVKLRNGNIGEIVACYGDNVEVEGSHYYFHNTDGTYSQNDTIFDIIEIEEEVIKSDLFQFQVGDIVEFGGVNGVVVAVGSDCPYPVIVELEIDEEEYFTLDGRFSTSHLKPLLNLVRRPKKKEKRVVKCKVHYSPDLDAVLMGDKLPGDCIEVELEKEIEVEV